ncbi:MAG: protein kinase [Bacteroides sp.]|nr:protein kinase [Bacteroides sp.]
MPHGLNKGAILKNGTYRIEKVLGQGSFGITYLATAKFTTQGNLGTMDVEAKVAIKEFFMSEVNGRSEDGSTVEGSTGSVFSNYRKKFKKEAENLSKLEHPNIVKVFDVFDENNTTYYVMEFLEGQNLDDYIKQYGFIEESEAIKIISEIGNALAYMHSKRMLHLDIKPKNIMRKSDGKDYLIDFGLSKQFTDDGEPESSTSIGLGTPGYAPIEQAEYKQDGSFPATLDVYALGATLFKMLTGKRPPESTYILNEGFPENELTAKSVSDNTRSVLEKAMAPIKKQRFQTVKSFINGFVEERTIVDPTPKPKPIPKSQPTPKPKPELEQEPQPAPTSNKSSFKWIWWVATIAIIIVGFIIWRNNHQPQPTTDDVVVLEPEKPKIPSIITDMEWDSPLGKAKYTGQVTEDSIAGSERLLPHGKGVATITDGQYAGSKYDGIFDCGNMNGEATYTYKNGDTFVGTFRNNQYYKGKYTQKKNGEYFEGTFKNGQPDKGTWHDKNGKPL